MIKHVTLDLFQNINIYSRNCLVFIDIEGRYKKSGFIRHYIHPAIIRHYFNK